MNQDWRLGSVAKVVSYTAGTQLVFVVNARQTLGLIMNMFGRGFRGDRRPFAGDENGRP